jgi:hypothetical protein
VWLALVIPSLGLFVVGLPVYSHTNLCSKRPF